MARQAVDVIPLEPLVSGGYAFAWNGHVYVLTLVDDLWELASDQHPSSSDRRAFTSLGEAIHFVLDD